MPLRLAMLGMWHTHADGMARQGAAYPDEFTWVGCHDPDARVMEARRRDWSARMPGLRYFDSAEALLAEDLDGVVVEGQVHENLRLARLALESGRPVLLEKPAGDDLAEHRAVVELARRRGLHLQMSYLFRYMSAVKELLTRAGRGELGEIYEFRARLPKELVWYDHFAEELRPYRGGMFFEMAGHLVDMLVTLLGPPRSVAPFMAHHHDGPLAEYVDNGVAVFGFERAWGIIEVPALETAPRSRRIEVYGTGGAAVIPNLGSGHLANDARQPIRLYTAGDEDWRTIDLAAAILQISDLREFAAVIAGKKPPDYSLDHDLAVQQALLMACGMDS